MGSIPSLKNPIFVAMDVDDDVVALSLAKSIMDHVGGIKVGPRLVYKYGAKLVQALSEIAPVFVDNKYHDIPSTVLAALKATFEAGASFATVHASNGSETLKLIAQLESELNKKRPFKVLSVTVLTSFNENSLPKNWQKQTAKLHVESLAQESIQNGLTGLVCSPEEVQSLKQKFPGAFLVTPGIRLSENDKGDQARTMGPAEAIKLGASALVVGRPILDSNDPKRAAQAFADAVK